MKPKLKNTMYLTFLIIVFNRVVFQKAINMAKEFSFIKMEIFIRVSFGLTRDMDKECRNLCRQVWSIKESGKKTTWVDMAWCISHLVNLSKLILLMIRFKKEKLKYWYTVINFHIIFSILMVNFMRAISNQEKETVKVNITI